MVKEIRGLEALHRMIKEGNTIVHIYSDKSTPCKMLEIVKSELQREKVD